MSCIGRDASQMADFTDDGRVDRTPIRQPDNSLGPGRIRCPMEVEHRDRLFPQYGNNMVFPIRHLHS